MVSSSKYIPFEVLIDNVLPRLPIKTLIRFTSVCKSWYSLFRNPNFIQNHLNHRSSNAPTGCLLVMAAALKDDSNSICSVLCEDTFSVLENFDFRFPVKQMANMGICCNGLICLTEAYDLVGENIYLCNPSIKKVKKLCSSPLADRIRNSGENVTRAMGFGFDEVANDYKVVRVYYTRIKSYYEFEAEAELYSLKKDEWKRIEANEWYFDGGSVAANGAIHWLYMDQIVAFDFHHEVFRKMELPEESDIAEDVILLPYNGLLALLSTSAVGSPNNSLLNVDIWVMKVYGATNSWTRQFDGFIEQGASFEHSRFTKNGKLIFEREGNMLASWDPETQQVLDLGFKEHQGKIVDEYEESLILL